VESCVVFAGRDQATLGRVAAMASAPYYHVTTSSEKNAYAMGIAFGEGIHERGGGQPGSIALHNYEAAVFAQSVFEMQRIVRLLGGEPASAIGLAGVGDLDVTCNGGRTGRFGKLLGLGLGVEAAIERMEGATLECLEILSVLRRALPGLEQRGELRENELPLLRHLIEVALDDKPIAMPFDRFFRS
jgi:glycerol-3-phosphate dehydrogenase (NAD(P)+)